MTPGVDRSSWHRAVCTVAAVIMLAGCTTTSTHQASSRGPVSHASHVSGTTAAPPTSAPPATSAPTPISTPTPTASASQAEVTTTNPVTHKDKSPTDPALRLAGKVIVIDPGHQLGNSTHQTQINRLVNAGGFMKACNTTGTSTNAGFPESTFAWDVAMGVRSRLEAAGAKVYLTRYTNSLQHWGPCIDTRGQLGNQVHADAVLSIHGDGADSQYRGFFVIMPGHLAGWTDDIYTSSHLLGADVHDALRGSGAVVANDYGGTGYSVRTDLGTLNWSNVPVVMVELGNMRNAVDASHMTSPTYRDEVYAHGLAVGVARFVLAH